MGVKMLEQSTVNRVIELDLPGVVDAKKRLFQQLIKRRNQLEMTTLVLHESTHTTSMDTSHVSQRIITDDWGYMVAFIRGCEADPLTRECCLAAVNFTPFILHHNRSYHYYNIAFCILITFANLALI